MIEFERGKWYVNGECYLHCEAEGCFRQAGKIGGGSIPKEYIEQLEPTTLAPDFSNAKKGDPCWSVRMGHCVITEVLDSWFMYICPATKKSSAIEMTGKDMWFNGNGYHDDVYPTMFHSFAQFQAYWAEMALTINKEEKK